MSGMRRSILINDTDPEALKMLLNLDEKDVTSSFIYDNFGEFDGKARLNPYDLMIVSPGSYGPEKKKNKNTFTTGVGIWIFNKWFIEKELFHIFGYINQNVTAGMFDDMNQAISYALMEDRLSVDAMKRYLIKSQLVMPYVTVLAPNHSEKILTCTKAINNKKDELIKKYKTQLDAGDVKAINDVEAQLLQFAVDYVGDDPSMDTFLSGARGSIGNNFKNLYIMKGAIRDVDPNAKQEYYMASSNYTDGIKAEEYALYCNSAAAGPYSRGKKTEFGGYMENLFAMGYQDVILDDPGSDCGTKRTKEVYLTKKNVKNYIYSYIVQNGQEIELTSQNMDKFIGKKVRMRFADLCQNEKICNKCAGEFFYKLGMRNVGLALMQIPSAFKNKAMKAFHDSTIGTTEMDCMQAFGLK